MHFVHTRADGAILVIGVLVDRAATTARSSDVSVASRSAHRRPRGIRCAAEGAAATPPFTEPFGDRACRLDQRLETPDRRLPEALDEGNSREVQPLNRRKSPKRRQTASGRDAPEPRQHLSGERPGSSPAVGRPPAPHAKLRQLIPARGAWHRLRSHPKWPAARRRWRRPRRPPAGAGCSELCPSASSRSASSRT